jgi:hypothetical protein
MQQTFNHKHSTTKTKDLKDLKAARRCRSCHELFMPNITRTPDNNGDILACDEYCYGCEAPQVWQKQYLEESYTQARIEEFERRQRQYAEWRMDQYEKRIEEIAEQQRAADEYRESRLDPDPDGWNATLRQLGGVA